MLFVFPLFVLVSFFCFTLPGVFLLKKASFKISPWESLFFGTVAGLIFFTLLSYLGIVLKLNFLAVPFAILLDILGLKELRDIFSHLTLPSTNRKLLLSLLFALGIIGQLLVIAPSGRFVNGDLVFWSAHGHDGMWHISLMEEMKKGFPLQNPVFAGERLVNYHFFSDIAPTIFSQYFRFSNLDLYFRFFPFIYSLLLGSLAYFLGKKIGGSFSTGVWATIFTYFAGSFGFIVTWIQSRTIGGESIFWATQIQSSIGNPPQIAAFIIVLTFLFFFIHFLENQKGTLKLLVLAMIAGSLIVFKVYGGIVLLGSLGIVGGWQLLKERRVHILILTTLSGLLSAILYLPNSTGSVGFLIWEPWWYIRTMVVIPGRLNLLDWELRRQTYLAEHNLKRVAQLEGTSFFIFLFGNLGLRFIGLVDVAKYVTSIFKNYLHLLLILILLSSFILPMLFLQKGVASNSIQFMQYFLLLMGIIAGIAWGKFTLKFKSSIQIALGFLIILLAVPTQVGLIYGFYSRPPYAKIDSPEQSALTFLRKNTSENSVVVTPPYNKYLDLHTSTPPIWAWFDTAYVSALSSRRTFLSDTEQVDIMGYKFNDRLDIEKQLFEETDPINFDKILRDNKISYLYFPIQLQPAIDLTKTDLQEVYSNPSIQIWKTN